MPGLTPEQYAVLRRPINSVRVAHRSQGGKDLSYLEAWDVKAHLTRVFGFCNYDAEVVHTALIGQNEYDTTPREGPSKHMYEPIWQATVRLVIRDSEGHELCRHTESAIGSAVGSSGLGDLHDNALKTAASDALKRCAINLGNQFGLSLYADGSTGDVIRKPIIEPPGVEDAQEAADETLSEASKAALAHSLGATEIAQEGTQDRLDDPADRMGGADDAPKFTNQINDPDSAAKALERMNQGKVAAK